MLKIFYMKVSLKFITNPFFLYITSFTIVFIIYSLNWSDAYPDLSFNLKLFFIVSFLIAFSMGFLFWKSTHPDFSVIPKARFPYFIILVIIFFYLLEFIDFGGVPLLMAFSQSDFSTKEFTGIPTLHTIISTFTLYYSVYIFQIYLSNKEKVNLFFLSVLFLPQILCVNRGPIIIVLSAMFFMYIIKHPKLKLKKFLFILLTIFVFFYLFGIAGNLRFSSSRKDPKILMKMSGSNQKLENSILPNEYYWTYLYIISPMGNLQNAIDKAKPDPSFKNFENLVLTQITPDFISKRITKVLGVKEDTKNYLVIRVINAPTMYSNSFILMGWPGIIILFLFSMGFVLFYIIIVSKKSVFFLSGWCILLTIFLFSTFNNMWRESAISFQLIYPIIFSVLERKKIFLI